MSPLRTDRDAVTSAMRGCPQTATQSVLDHGISVQLHFRQMIAHLETGEPLPGWWRLPEWASEPGLLGLLPPQAILDEYQVYHDCGKPGVLTVDADGRRHFPGHAAASEAVWLAAGGDPLAARLMGMDMDAHLLKAEGIAEFAARPEAAALLLTAVAEVHSNAAMFGGTDSDGFKIKAKHLVKRGGQVMAAMKAAGAMHPHAACGTSGRP